MKKLVSGLFIGVFSFTSLSINTFASYTREVKYNSTLYQKNKDYQELLNYYNSKYGTQESKYEARFAKAIATKALPYIKSLYKKITNPKNYDNLSKNIKEYYDDIVKNLKWKIDVVGPKATNGIEEVLNAINNLPISSEIKKKLIDDIFKL